MGIDAVGSGVILAIAAVLWLGYLMPTWLRRREYLSTERNAVRLQQTLRILAETAELPQAIRAETSARSAAQHEKFLRRQQRQADAARKAGERLVAAAQKSQDAALARAAARRVSEQPAPQFVAPVLAQPVARPQVVSQPSARRAAATPAVASSTVIASRRLRRSRAATSLLLLASLAAAGIGVTQLLATGAWMLLGTGAIVAVCSLAMLGQMASVARSRAHAPRAVRSRPAVASAPLAPQAPPIVEEPSTWTPVPLPKPLYMSRPRVERAVAASLEAAAELRQAAADADRKLREAQSAPEVTPIRPAAAAPSRFASMGIVEPQQQSKTDLDAVLRRRRA